MSCEWWGPSIVPPAHCAPIHCIPIPFCPIVPPRPSSPSLEHLRQHQLSIGVCPCPIVPPSYFAPIPNSNLNLQCEMEAYRDGPLRVDRFIRQVEAALKALVMGKSTSGKQTLAGDAFQPWVPNCIRENLRQKREKKHWKWMQRATGGCCWRKEEWSMKY